MTLDSVVTDHARKPVSGLQRQDFTLLDNQNPQAIVSFRASDVQEADTPVEAIVVVDALNTPYQGAAYQQKQLADFLRQNGGKLPMPFSVVVLTEKESTTAGPSLDGVALADGLSSKKMGLRVFSNAQGSSGEVEQAQRSLETLEGLVSAGTARPGRKFLIWLGPAWPLASRSDVQLSRKDRASIFSTIVALSAALRQAHMTLYNIDPLEGHTGSGQRIVVDTSSTDYLANDTLDYQSFVKGLDSAQRVQNANLAFQVLSVQSGGQVFNGMNGIAESMGRCLNDATNYYTITFVSPAGSHPDEYHKLQLKIDKSGLTARTRTGYYAQP
jgi:VWFA-related protein